MSASQVQRGLETFFYLAWKVLYAGALTREDLNFLVTHQDFTAFLTQAATLIKGSPYKYETVVEQELGEEGQLQHFFLLAHAALRPSELDDSQRQFLDKHRNLVGKLLEASSIIGDLGRLTTLAEDQSAACNEYDRIVQGPGGVLTTAGAA